MDIKGILEFSKGVLCKKDALGKQYHGKIADIDVTITFPSVSIKEKTYPINCVGLSNPLKAPMNGKNIKKNGEPLFWGCPMVFPGLNSFVKCALIELSCDFIDVKQTPQNIYEDIYRWEQAFTSYCQLCTKQHFEQKVKQHHRTEVLLLFSSEGYIQSNEPFCINGTIHSDNEFVSEQQLSEAISFASSGKELLLEYQMLLSAYEDRKHHHYRQAVVDACSAVEICLNNQIAKYCDSIGLKKGIITDKYRYLSDKFKLISEVDSTIPKYNYKNDVVDVRNAVVHSKSINPSKREIDTLISIVECVLGHFNKDYY